MLIGTSTFFTINYIHYRKKQQKSLKVKTSSLGKNKKLGQKQRDFNKYIQNSD